MDNRKYEIIKMKFKDKNEKVKSINIIEAIYIEYYHPHSIPKEILLKTKDVLVEDSQIVLQFLVKSERNFRQVKCKVSPNYKKHEDEPNDYSLLCFSS